MSSYYKRRFYRKLSHCVFFLILFAKPIIGVIGIILFYFSMYQVMGLVPIILSFQLESFYYSQSAVKVDLNVMEKYHDSFVVAFEHGPILSAQSQDPEPWYQRLGFIKYSIQRGDEDIFVSDFSGYFTTGHYYNYAIYNNGEQNLEISGQTHPLSYTHQTLIKGKWLTNPEEFYYSFDDFIFMYDDPVTWARVRVPNIFFKAKRVRVGDNLHLKHIDARLRIEQPDITTSVYSSLSIHGFEKNDLQMKNFTADMLLIDASTFYVQDFGEFCLQNIRYFLDSHTEVSWDLTVNEFIEGFEKLYPKITLITVDGILQNNFDIELRQNKDIGLEVVSTGAPSELIALMDLMPWAQWDIVMRTRLQDYDNQRQPMVSIIWSPGQRDSLEFFAISPDMPKIVLD